MASICRASDWRWACVELVPEGQQVFLAVRAEDGVELVFRHDCGFLASHPRAASRVFLDGHGRRCRR